MYQDNLIAMLLENNGRLSSVNWMKHIRVRYFLIKGRIAMGDLKVKYFPTGEMLDGHFTRPLQGAALQNFIS